MLTKELRNGPFRGLSLRRSENEIDQLVVVDIDRASIDFEEQQRRFQSDSLVAIDERMVPGHAKGIGRGERSRIGLAVSCEILRTRKRGKQGASVANAHATAMLR